MIAGSCLCGKVKYKISGTVGDIVHCHCQTCRKAHAAAFSSVAQVKKADILFSGSHHLNSFESSSGKRRYFCSNCGSQMYSQRDGHKHLVLRLGSLDTHPRLVELKHSWISQKAEWYVIDSHLPQRQEF